MTQYAHNRAIPVVELWHEGIPVGCIYKIRIECERPDSRQADISDIKRDLRSKNRSNIKRRRCKVRVKQDVVRTAWSCSKFAAKFNSLAPPEAFRNTKVLCATLGMAVDVVTSAGIILGHKSREFRL